MSDREDYCLISPHNYEAEVLPRAYTSGSLPARYYQLPPDPQLTRGYRFGLSLRARSYQRPAGTRLARAAHRRALCGTKSAQAVVACTGDFLDLPAGYLASRLGRRSLLRLHLRLLLLPTDGSNRSVLRATLRTGV